MIMVKKQRSLIGEIQQYLFLSYLTISQAYCLLEVFNWVPHTLRCRKSSNSILRHMPVLLLNLQSWDVRKEHSPASVRIFYNIMKEWNVSPEDVHLLLGVSSRYYKQLIAPGVQIHVSTWQEYSYADLLAGRVDLVSAL